MTATRQHDTPTGPTVRASDVAIGRPASHGFTLIELMVVVAIIALAGQIVVVNLGALIPSSTLNSEATRLIGDIEFMRSEARLQGKPYRIELDLDLGRWRIVLPPEERLVSEQTVEESRPLNWQDLDERVRFAGHLVHGSPVLRRGRTAILIDRNGFTAEQMIHLKMKSEALDEMVWTIRLHGLDRRSRLLTNETGAEPTIEVAEEFSFR